MLILFLKAVVALKSVFFALGSPEKDCPVFSLALAVVTTVINDGNSSAFPYRGSTNVPCDIYGSVVKGRA